MLNETPSNDQKAKRKYTPLGCFGWILVFIGALILASRYWYSIWDWALLFAGVYFIVDSFSEEDRQQFFPGVILVITAGAMVLRKIGLVDFSDWQFWPILFGSIGVGFITLWITALSRIWALIVGGIILLAAGAGFGASSFWIYQRHLRHLVDFLPIALVIAGMFLLFRFWRNRSDRPN